MDLLPLLSPEILEKIDRANLNKREQLATALIYIGKNHPEARFKCQDLAIYLGMDPQFPRGIIPMLQSIKRRIPDFPIHLVETSQRQKFDVDKIDHLIRD